MNEGNCRFFEVNPEAYFCEGNDENCRFLEVNPGACFCEGNDGNLCYFEVKTLHPSVRGTMETAVSLK